MAIKAIKHRRVINNVKWNDPGLPYTPQVSGDTITTEAGIDITTEGGDELVTE